MKAERLVFPYGTIGAEETARQRLRVEWLSYMTANQNEIRRIGAAYYRAAKDRKLLGVCCSRGHIVRREHSFDKDGRCIFCNYLPGGGR